MYSAHELIAQLLRGPIVEVRIEHLGRDPVVEDARLHGRALVQQAARAVGYRLQSKRLTGEAA